MDDIEYTASKLARTLSNPLSLAWEGSVVALGSISFRYLLAIGVHRMLIIR